MYKRIPKPIQGMFSNFAMPLLKQKFPSLSANDIIGVQPMFSPKMSEKEIKEVVDAAPSKDHIAEALLKNMDKWHKNVQKDS